MTKTGNQPPPTKVTQPVPWPIIVGTGPAGLFCAFGLLERGVKSVLVERGREVVTRRKDVAKLMRDGSEVGQITSSIVSPRLGKVLALAYVRRGHQDAGTPLTAVTAQGSWPAEVVALPLAGRERCAS